MYFDWVIRVPDILLTLTFLGGFSAFLLRQVWTLVTNHIAHDLAAVEMRLSALVVALDLRAARIEHRLERIEDRRP